MANMQIDEVALEIIDSVRFGFYTTEEIREISVKAITKPDVLDAKNAPVPDGLYDPALGPIIDKESCKSCLQKTLQCPGHCGHIDLVKPVYNPLLFQNLKGLLQIACFHCHRFKMVEAKVQIYVSQLELILHGDIAGARNLRDLSLSESFSLEEHMGNVAQSTSESCSSSENLKKQTFTSFQYAEVKDVLAHFVKKSPRKKCENCGVKNPKITCPTFGWLNKVIHGSDIRANFIQKSNLGIASIDGDQQDTSMVSDTENGEVLQSGESARQTVDSKEALKGLKDLPGGFIEQMNSSGQSHLLPPEVEHILDDLWKKNTQLCKIICDIQCKNLSAPGKSNGYEMFILKALLVPPSKFRPPAGSSSRGVLEHPQNVLYSKVLEANNSLRNLIATNPDHPDIVRKWMDLQRSVNTLFDSSKGFGKSDRETSGLRQLLEKKTGILRQKMMGKRVNFACRSVISPDPYLAVNEIGIPPYFALRLTYPERVTPWNVDSLRHAVENGADVHPGATHYKDRETVYKLQADRHTRNAISRKLPTSRGVLVPSGKAPQSEFEGKVVYRHLKDGDIVLVNRQPTLHKPSMMAHVVRVLPGERTIRMHYANCSTYNADFDGDEMNVHLPQDEISRAEAKNIVNANEQYIVPSKGEPIRGLIQDHIVGAVLLTKKDTFLTRDEYHQLLCACVPSAVPSSQRQKISTLYDDIKPLPPAIWKPTPLWTGKQAISAVLHYITRDRAPFTIEKPGLISKEYFSENSSEHTMHVYNNELIHGVIDKSQFGGYGLVHTVHELYGSNTAGTLLSLFSRLFTLFLQMHGFTCGVDDLIVVPSSNLEMERILEESGAKSEEVHRRFTGTQSIDLVPKELHGEIEKVIQRNGDSATTLLDVMTCNSVAKITSEINRTLFPNGLRKPFPLNCFSLMTSTGAKGNQVNFQQIVSLLGQQLLEGKRVPRMISGKTLPCFPSWDISCRAGGFISDRFLTGLRPQEYYFHCMAGREGLVDTAIKTSRSGYLQRCIMKNLECLKVCYDYTVRDADGSVIQFTYGEDGVDVLKSSFLSELKILATNHKVVLEKLSGEPEDVQLSKSNGFIKKLPPSLREEVRILVKEKRKNAATHLSKKQQGCIHQIQNKDIMRIVELKYLSSLADPGESVGVLAAQSIGEPSTQMTLNTFHNAGRGETNVTLGIPRLQEILMNAKEFINTPIMKCPLLDGKSLEDAEHLAARFRRISVADVVESMEVVCIDPYRHRGLMSTLYKLKMKLYPIDLWPPPHSDFTIEALNGILEGSFVLAMEGAINKHLETLSKTSGSSVFSGKESSTLEEGGDEDAPDSKNGNDEGGDGDNEDGENTEDQGTDVEKRRRQATDEMEYDDGNEKASSRGEGDRGGALSGSESEVDQAEIDEDFMMDGGIPDAEAEVELPESSSKLGHSTSVPEPGKKARKPEIERKKTKKPTRSRKKIERVVYKKIKGSKFEAHFIFRGEEPCILLEEIAKMTAKQVYLKEYKKIEQCLAGEGNRKGKEKDKKFIELQTAGVNFTAFWDLEDHLNINKLESNDIHAMLKTYGVEAARATIINEVTNVFSTYGIKVNIRHLSLIADFMTSHGGYRAMNRLGMGSFSTSPFSKMTFETATKFIFEAASRGEVDEMESPSASVSLGQPVKLGTGCFGLMHNLL